jgi:hypothetical protein
MAGGVPAFGRGNFARWQTFRLQNAALRPHIIKSNKMRGRRVSVFKAVPLEGCWVGRQASSCAPTRFAAHMTKQK